MHAALIEPSPWDTDELPDQPADPDDPDPAPDDDEVGGGCAAAGR